MPTPSRPDRPIAGLERHAARVSGYAGGLFVLLLVGLHVIEPEYDPDLALHQRVRAGPLSAG